MSSISNLLPFTSRMIYAVEEISYQEYLRAISQQNKNKHTTDLTKKGLQTKSLQMTR